MQELGVTLRMGKDESQAALRKPRRRVAQIKVEVVGHFQK
jgi:hypothetical protein